MVHNVTYWYVCYFLSDGHIFCASILGHPTFEVQQQQQQDGALQELHLCKIEDWI